jgi:hypothetical protein
MTSKGLVFPSPNWIVSAMHVASGSVSRNLGSGMEDFWNADMADVAARLSFLPAFWRGISSFLSLWLVPALDFNEAALAEVAKDKARMVRVDVEMRIVKFKIVFYVWNMEQVWNNNFYEETIFGTIPRFGFFL